MINNNLKTINIIHKQIPNLPKTGGFALENGKPNQTIKILNRCFITSDEKDFYTYINQLSDIYLEKVGTSANFMHNFLILCHKDLSVDIYINDLPICIEVLSKKDVKKDELIYENDIADIRRLRFQGIEIKNTDNIIFCFKYGWKFGLFFDLTYQNKLNPKLDLNKLYFNLGTYYKKLAFQYLYKVFENNNNYKKIRQDGWFPYIELIGSDYKELINAYINKYDFTEKTNKIIAKFNGERIKKISEKWWKNSIYNEKKKIINAGINNFLKNDDEGFISAIKILYPEIEGILATLFANETKMYSNKSEILLIFLKNKGLSRTNDIQSMLFPEFFSNFLQEYLFPKFDFIKDKKITLSKHTGSHGVVRSEEYTKIRALQAILILDQIYFFIQKI
jgi:hypothetical protein